MTTENFQSPHGRVTKNLGHAQRLAIEKNAVAI
jgi:hypothetical protein